MTGRPAVVAVAVALACGLVLSGCGSSGGASSNGGDSAGQPVADVAAAQAVIAPLTGSPTAFPVETPLGGQAQGKRIAYMDCGSPICGLFFTLGEPAAKQLGMELTRIKAGLSADSVNAAFNTVVQSGYDGVFVPAIQPSLWKRGLEQLAQAKIPVVTAGILGPDKGAIAVSQVSDGTINRVGTALAASVVADTGDASDVVFYVTPEIAFNPVLGEAFLAGMATLCPACPARTENVPAATLGTRAPALIVDDLQGHPKTTTAVFAQSEQTSGLPAALGTAGVQVTTLATFPDPQTLQLIKSGAVDRGLAFDAPVVAWTLMDSLARLTTGQPPAPGAVADTPPLQLLTADDLPADNSRGWSGYPDFRDRFAALWAPR